MLDVGFMAEARAKTVQQEREEVYAALQYAASFHCLVENGKIVTRMRKERERSMERSGVLIPTSIDV